MSHFRLLLCAVLLLGNTKAQSDPPPIELLTLRTSDQIVALATRGGRPLPSTPLELRWWPAGGAMATLQATTAADGMARFAFAARELQRTPIVVARAPGSCAVTAVTAAPRFSDYGSHRAHLMVDRPIYRPGETIRGRAVVHACEPGPRLAPVVLPLAGARLDVELHMADRRTLAATVTTDLYGCAAFEFALPADARTGEVTCRLGHGRWQHDEALCAIAAFRRPSLHCTLAVPPPPAPEGGVDIDVSAEYAAGGPAAHQRGLLQVADLTLPFQLDQLGRARVPLDAPTLARYQTYDALPMHASLVGPDGVACVTHGELSLTVIPPAPAALAVGDQLAVPVRGEPGDIGMVAVAHRGLVAVRSVQLDARGHGRATFRVAADWQPGVQVHAVGLRSQWRAFREWRGQPFTLAVASPLRIDVAVQRLGPDGVATALPPGAPCAPGDELELQIATSCAGAYGATVPQSALLSVGVVDEQVFALSEDRTEDPRAALAPTLPGAAVLRESSLSAATRGLALRELFVRGRLEGWPPLAELPGRVSYGPSGATVPAPAGVSVAPRRRLAATAAFVPALVAAQGRARLRVRLPDDVTTWRITVAAIGGSAAALRRAQVVARPPVSVSAALPRFLRAGDELLGARLVHAGDAPPQRSPLPLSARDLGELPINLEARLGTHRDRLELALPVRSAATFAPWCVTQVLAGDAVLTPPGHAPRGEPCELLVLGGASAILAEAAEFVGTYPYGCVEQTTSSFLPHLAALRAGAAPDPERASKIDAGLRRLRQLSLGRERGFAYWPGWREVDVGMSAYVIHALCLARDLGLDLAAHDLEPAPERGAHAALVRRAAGQASLESVELDLLIALAHWSGPASPAAQALARQVSGARLSAGQLARAARCLPEAAAREAARAAGANELATYDLANLLLAWRRLAPSGAEVARLETELLLRHRDGRFGTTQATAAVVVALAASGARAGATFAVEVVQGDLRQTLRVQDGARLRLPTSEPVAVSAPGSVHPVVLLRGRAPVPPERAARGVHFARYLLDADTGRRVGRCVAVGQRVKLVVELAEARPRSYVALDCPIPAGFEVQSADAGWDVSDERAVFALAQSSRQVQRAELTLVAAFAGEVAWPAAVATAMYDDAPGICTAAERLQIAGR